jgi:glycosyltransferase involved in cell wall biosynthesis
MKTVLHVIPTLGVGGAERQLGYLAPELARMGHKVHVAYSREAPGTPDMPGVSLHRLKARSSYDPTLIGELVGYIRRVRPDIVHTWILQMDIAGGIAARLSNTRWILREPSSAMAYPSSWKHRLRVRVASGADAIVSNSRGGADYWSALLPESRRYVVRNGVPINKIDDLEAGLPDGMAEPGVPIILSAGRLTVGHTGSKNLKTWLEVLARIKRQKAVCGIVCGEGPQRLELECVARELGLETDVQFTGHLPAPAVWRLMKKASVFVSLSAFEGCPNTVVEAMACGSPVVVSDIPAHREILDESCTRFVDPTDVAQVADVILDILDNPHGASNRAATARKRIQSWSIREMARGFEWVYDNVLQRGS